MGGGIPLGQGTEQEEQCLGQMPNERSLGLPGPRGGVRGSWSGGGPKLEGVPGQETVEKSVRWWGAPSHPHPLNWGLETQDFPISASEP